MVPQDDAMRASLLGRLKIVLASVATSATPDPELLARLHHRIGQLHTLPGRIAQALESFEQAHDLAESADSARTQAAVDADLALAYLLTGRAERALTLAQTAAEAARHSGDVGTRLRALAVVARIETHALHIDDASAIICDARMTAERHGDPEAQQAAFRMAHAFAALAGRLDLIENVEPAALDVVCCLARAEALRASGDLQGARASYRAVLTQESAASNAQLLRRRDVGVAMLDVLREAPERVVDILASRVADDESNGRYLGAIYGRLIWGTGLALAGEHRAGWEQLQQGLRDAREHRLWVVLADFAPVAATVAWAAGGAQEAAELLSRWDGPSRAETLPWHVALAQLARAVVVGQTLPESGAQERWTMLAIRRLAETASRATSGVVPAQAAPIATMEIGPKWRWFRVDGGDAVELIRRNAGRRMLQHLVGAWATDPGEAIARDRLIQVGWPGEKMSVESAAARVHTTLWRLRKLGLADVLVTTADGYRLRTDLRIVEHERADGGSY
ncbi:MAG: tetratricopeptide (TPR) repeat protein [Myxococcota bacterium]|jgi:tetratricopeptide (TPR) repeat protein